MVASCFIVAGTFFGAELENGTFHGAELENGTFHAAWDPFAAGELIRKRLPTDPEPLGAPVADEPEPAPSGPVPTVSSVDDNDIESVYR